MIKRALISVSDKTGIVEFAKGLVDAGVEIISTGGTFKKIKEAGIEVTGISQVTGFPECLDGRVKTLHPKVHAGILAMRSNPDHMKQLKELEIETIDMVVINLYPFKQTILKENVAFEEAIENIDIGGPTMLRSAAKNYNDVTVITDPCDYKMVLEQLKKNKDVDKKIKIQLAHKVFEHTAHYDAIIAGYLKKQYDSEVFGETLTLTYEKVQDMRYGENPHQGAAFYKEVSNFEGFLSQAKQLHGKALSYNNINDTNGAIDIVKDFEEIVVVGVKHANPCGVAIGKNVFDAYTKAYEADPVSIFGGIIATNTEIDKKTAEKINGIYVEIVIAPSFSKEALDILMKKKNVRLLEMPGIGLPVPKDTFDMKRLPGGLLIQEYNTKIFNKEDIKVVTETKVDDKTMEELIFAMKIVKNTKSNAIVLTKDMQTVGVGPGQANRVGALKIALDYAKAKAKDSVMASDAFFPFPDCVEEAAKAGIKAIIQPGGSIRDQESIDACNKYGIAMVVTGMRHFKH